MKNTKKNIKNHYDYSLYKKFAKYYDSFYYWKDYKSEAKKYRDLIKKFKKSPGKEMLDVACGTGNHFKFLKNYFNITGLDVNPYMLKIARQKHPDVKLILDDMRTFRISRQFDVIVCLFSSIAHLKTYSNLEKAVKNFSHHLVKGGVIIIEPFVHPKLFYNNYLDSYNVNEPGLKLSRFSISRRKGNIAIYDFHFLIGEKGKIRYFKETVHLGMFEVRKVLNILKRCGIKAGYLKSPKGYRGMFAGVKQK